MNSEKLTKAVSSLKSGNIDSFEIIYKLTYNRVFFFALSITKDPIITEDIVQEVYCAVLKNIESLKKEKSFIFWLNKITYNISIRELKKNTLNITDEEIQKKLIDRNDPLINYIEDEKNKEIFEKIFSLKEKYRVVLILKYFNNYKIKEISLLLDCPEGTVKSRLNTAKSILKEKLNKNRMILSFAFGIMLSGSLTKMANAYVGNQKKQNNRKKSLKSNYILKKIILISIVGISLTSILLVNKLFNRDKNNNVLVTYNNKFTNESVDLKLKFNYLRKKDIIKVIYNDKEIDLKKMNDKEFRINVVQNGNYLIIKNDEVISSININNIDKEPPIIKTNIINGNVLELLLEDNLSGIDYNKIEVFLEDDSVHPIKIDEESNKIYINCEKGKQYLKVFDNCGNFAIYEIEIN